MSSGTLFGVPLSQPVRSCLLLINEAGLDVNFETVDMRAGEHKQEAFLKKNPYGKIPAYTEGDFNIGEGAAILAYLASKNNLTNWYPSDLQARAKVDQWLHWHHTGTRKSSGLIMRPLLFGGEVNTSAFETELLIIEKSLSNSKFIASNDHPTIADLMIVPELDQLGAYFHEVDLIDFSPYPNTVRYLADIKEAIPSYEQNRADALATLKMVKEALKAMQVTSESS